MAEMGLRSRMLVRDVMSSPAVTVDESTTADKVAKLMDKNDYGCIIVTTKNGKPLGIITERDLVVRVLAKNKKPDMVKARHVMTAPLMTIEPDVMITEAGKKMSKLDIRRLAVMYKGKLEGIIASKDILAVMPELLETIQETAIIEGQRRAERAGKKLAPMSGYCDQCGVYSDTLTQINGEFLCEECRGEAGSEE